MTALLAEVVPLLDTSGDIGDLIRILDACDLDVSDAGPARDLTAPLDATGQAQGAAGVPTGARKANGAIVDFLAAFAAGTNEYADRVDTGEDPTAVENELGSDIVRPAIAADGLLRRLLESCGGDVGLSITGATPTPQPSEAECAEVFAWYETSAERFAELNAATMEEGVPFLEFGLALPGGYGSPDLDAGADGDEAYG